MSSRVLKENIGVNLRLFVSQHGTSAESLSVIMIVPVMCERVVIVLIAITRQITVLLIPMVNNCYVQKM